MSGITTGTVLAAVGAAAAVSSAVYTISQSGAKVATGAPTAQINNAQSTAMSARTNLLETAGGAAGSPLGPGQVGGNKDTIFGN